MKQGFAFLILAITILLAMTGGTFLYRKAFKKEQLIYRVTSIKLVCSDRGNVISFDPYIDVYAEDSTLLHEDVEPNEKFSSPDTIEEIILKGKVGDRWIDLSDSLFKDLELVDAGTGRRTSKRLTLNDWRTRYNAQPKSTWLMPVMSTFRSAPGQHYELISLQMKMSGTRMITDTCIVK